MVFLDEDRTNLEHCYAAPVEMLVMEGISGEKTVPLVVNVQSSQILGFRAWPIINDEFDPLEK
jgi:hypothetical protein